MKKITFVLHGKHLRKHRIQYEAEKYLEKEFVTDYFITKTSKSAEDFAEKIANSGTDYLIAVGGDGTMHEVVNGIMQVPKDQRENLIIGLLPVGSGNDFARTLNLSGKISYLYKLISNNSLIDLDVGKIECKALDGKDTTVYFNNIAGVGLDAEVAKRVNEGNKAYGPNVAYYSATVKSFLNYRKKQIKVSSADFNYEGNVLLLSFANAKYFGSGLGIAPHAKVNDGKMALTLAGDVSLFDYLKNVGKLRKCAYLKHPGIVYDEAESMNIEPIGEPCYIEADGELVGKLPLKVSMLHKEIKFLTEVKE
ncbi:MAG: diacylglycerol kinase family protein [Melioribacteraceae bacterium]